MAGDRIKAAVLLGALSVSAPALAQTRDANGDSDVVFVLGRIDSGLAASDGERIGGSTIGAEDMRRYGRESVDEAIDLLPGANASATGGSRNERLILVRGFDRFQTTLSLDGVRVFLPADNRIDFGRFLTADLAEVQVAKGYVSVLNGPGGVGGAVNLVTRKPARQLETELTATATGDGELGNNGYTVSGLIGARQDHFYVQASGAQAKRDSWSLSDEFKPTTLEDGGKRGNSATSDWRVNLKAGWTPNDTDEYAISYLKQSGEKNAPYSVSDTANTRFWSWPYWDIENVYLLTRTRLAEGLELRGRLYHASFDNLLSAFDSASQTTQSLPRAFDSYYADVSYGGNLTLEARLGASNKLTGALFYRRDQHKERQDGFVRTPPAPISPSLNAPYAEPWQTSEEDTWSLAIEDVQALGSRLDLVTGLSYDWTELKRAEDVNVAVSGSSIANSVIAFQPVAYPTEDMNAVNAQAALVWRPTDAMSVRISVSSRTRFPTLFERFSSRFGAAIPNPGIGPERAANYEIGGSLDLSSNLHLEGAVFYSDLDDALVQAPVSFPAPIGNVNQTRNAGAASYYGAEAELRAELGERLSLGAAYTYIERNFTVPGTPAFEPQGTPKHKLFLHADWRPLGALTLSPSIEYNSDRWTVTSAAPIRYYETGEVFLVNFAADWEISSNVSLLAGVRNLGDADYQLVDGFPEEGRNVYLSLRVRN